MCQLHLIKKYKSKIDDYDLNQMSKLMLFGSKFNNDAFGLFNQNNYFKSGGKFNEEILPRDKLIKDTNFIIGHNRASTSMSFWDEKVNQHHPFVLNDLVLVHNGVISNYRKIKKKYNLISEIKTDSYIILYLIDMFLNQSKKSTRKQKLVDAINKTLSELEGTISIFLYDAQLDCLIYYKNMMTEFSLYILDEKILVGSTKYDNIDYVYQSIRSRREIFIENGTVYEITSNPKKPIITLSSIEESSGLLEKWFIYKIFDFIITIMMSPFVLVTMTWDSLQTFFKDKKSNNQNLKGGLKK